MKHLHETLQESIALQRTELLEVMQTPLQQLAARCIPVWADREKLDQALSAGLKTLPYGRALYALDTNAIQISSNVGADGLMPASCGRNRSTRPYMAEVLPITGTLLSEAYISLIGRRPSLTAVQVVRDGSGAVLGFIGTDFDLRDLPLTRKLYDEPVVWRQIKGDPSIRSTVYHQNRVESALDQQLDTVLGVIEELMVYHGVYHVMLHFSSNRAVIWEMGDPYRYRMLDIDALVDPDICLAYPRKPSPADALVPRERIRAVLDLFRELRFMDDTFYLRSGTLNVFNGIVGLTFSCDGSHYIPHDEFLRAGFEYWVKS
ncbi:MAG: PDC sensor domain-containing protein [Gammaproteobacteria bacterium]|nr:PDC sensor domain-containing protein [Gammaproteobacteria bacterium]